jgi:hypothetical protein
MEASTLGGEDEDEEEDPGSPEKARAVFERGYKELKTRGEKENVSSQGADKSVRLLIVNSSRSESFCWKPGRLSRRNMATKSLWQRYRH